MIKALTPEIEHAQSTPDYRPSTLPLRVTIFSPVRSNRRLARYIERASVENGDKETERMVMASLLLF
ncbi:MAG: hypothetical protein LC776_05375 [Acidobacteria bacterium]|nr:hypothetical protein [Acidobacteriota bacterium]